MPTGRHTGRSLRLPDYDYSQPGAYFVTICCRRRFSAFGQVDNGAMVLNAAGTMAEHWLRELPRKYPDIELDVFCVMPDHVHFVIAIPDSPDAPEQGDGHTGPPLPRMNDGSSGGDAGQLPPLPRMVQWYKTMTTNEYIRRARDGEWEPFPGKLWQRSFHDRVIRSERELRDTRRYVAENPLRWSIREE